jgi:SdrD B-like domain
MNKKFTNVQLRFALRLLCVIALTGLPILTQTVLAAGTITGTVFRDYNGNGVKDTSNPTEPGVSGVTINAYTAANMLAGTVTSGLNGTYTTPSVTGTVRLEFIIPTNACDLDSIGTFPSTTGNVYGTSVRFVAEGATGVNFAVSSPSEYYTTNNPLVGVPFFNAGDPTGGGTAGTNSAFEVFNYTSDSNTPTPASRATLSQVGAVWGNAYSPYAGKYFVSTVLKRHVGTGPLGASGIYIIDPNTASSGSSFINLAAVGAAASNTSGTYPYNDGKLPSGTNNQAITFSDVVGANTGVAGAAHRGLPKDVAAWAASTTFSSYDAAAFEQAGKLSLGGLEISADGRYLYTVNLFTKALVRVDLRNAQTPVTPTAAQITSYPIPDPGCTGGNFRPWAAKFYRGKVYVGGVCDAQTTGVAANLKAYVYEFNTTTNAFNSTAVINGFALDYTKGAAISIDNGTSPISTKWYPWVNNYNTLLQTFASENTKFIRPQPILSDIEFDDADGSMILAFIDRTGLQVGYRNYGPRDVQPDLQTTSSSTTNGAVEVGGGDILRFYKNPTGCVFNAESGGISNGVSGSGAGNTEGPGGGEFFGVDSYKSNLTDTTAKHGETALGALAVNYGSRQIMATNYDAFSSGDVNAGGVRRFDMATGGLATGSNGYNIYSPTTRGVTFAKGNGLGDIEMLSQVAPIELGNRVWRDTNNNGVQDPGEAGIANVTVHLYNASNVLIATAVTNAAGEYYFISGTAVDSDTTNNIGIVNGPILPNANYQIRLDLPANYNTGAPLNGLFLTVRDQTSQLGFADGSDSDGVLVASPVGSPSGGFPVIAVTTGGAGNNNHNSDFGFSATPTAANVSVGGRAVSPSGSGLRGVFVTLREANGTSYTTVTNSFGYYLFNEIQAGQIITVGVESKRYVFNQPTQIINLSDNIADLQFTSTSR